jgi:hypothetical protein
VPQRGNVIQPRVGALRQPWEYESKSSPTLKEISAKAPSGAGARSIAPRELLEIAQSNAPRSDAGALLQTFPFGLKMF